MGGGVLAAGEVDAVTLRRCGRSVQVGPVPPAVLDALRSVARVAARTPGGCVRFPPTPLPLHHAKPGPKGPDLSFPAGLEPAVHAALLAAGHSVRVQGQPLPPLPAPDVTGLVSLGISDPGLLAAVHDHPQALVRYDPAAVDPALLVAQVARAWPAKRVAAVVQQIDAAHCLRDDLRRHGLDARAVSSKNEPPVVGPVVVATPMGLGHTPVAVEWLDVVLVLDGLAATGKRFRECLSHAWRARMYGLLPTDARPAPLERDLLTCLFGFAEIRLPRHGCRERPVQTILYLIESGPELPLSSAGMRLKRRGLWQNSLRNRKVAQLASAFREGDREKVKDLLGDNVAVPTLPRGVLVLVENVEHALALANQLLDWPLFAGPDVHEDDLTPAQVEELHTPRNPFSTGPLHAIVTATALPGVDLVRVGVLLRADGGVGLPPLGPEQLVEPDEGPVQPLLLIDLHDRHHPVLRRQSRQRQEAYERRGWFAPAVDPVQARAERFLANRPPEEAAMSDNPMLRLLLDLGTKAWTKVEQSVVQTHTAENPAETAREVAHSWVEAFGPALQSWRVAILNRNLHTAAKLGFREVDTSEGLAERCEATWRRWDTFREGVNQTAESGGACGQRVGWRLPPATVEPGVPATPEAGVLQGVLWAPRLPP